MSTSEFQIKAFQTLAGRYCKNALHVAQLLHETITSVEIRNVVIRDIEPQIPDLLSTLPPEYSYLTADVLVSSSEDILRELTNAVVHHSILLEVTEERFVDFVTVAEEHSRYAMYIYEYLVKAIYQLYGIPYPELQLPIRNIDRLFELLTPCFNGEKQQYFIPTRVNVVWRPMIDLFNDTAKLIDQRDEITKDLPTDFLLPPMLRSEPCPPPQPNWFRRIKDAKLFKQQLEGITEGKTFKFVDDITADLGLPPKCEPTVRRHLRNLQAKGKIPSVRPGHRFALDNTEYAVALPYLQKKMKHLIARYQVKK